MKLGGYLGAEEGVHDEPPGCALTLLVSVPLTLVGVGFLGWHGSALVVAVGIVLILLAVGVAVLAWRLPGKPFPVLYCYEQGAIRWQPGGAVDAYSWSELVAYQWSQRISVGQAANEHVIPWLELRTEHDAMVAAFTGDSARRISVQVARAQLVVAERLLSRDGELRYGAFRLTRRSLTVNDHTLPWSVVRSVERDGDGLAVFRRDQRRPVARANRRATPHECTLLTLVSRQLAANGPSESV